MDEGGTFWVDEEEGILVFKNEEGEDRFYVDDELELDGNKYLILVSADDEEDDEALVLKLIKEGNDEILTIIEDDEEFERVKEAYIESYEQE